jgi:hypothetical protein
VNEEPVYANPNFQIVLLTKEERKILRFWCPKTLVLIDKSNWLGAIALWNEKPGRHSMKRDEWIRALQLTSSQVA